MNQLATATIVALIAISSTAASAEGRRERTTTGQATNGYSYCLRTSPGPGDCKYASFQQCQAALSGRDGECVRNVGPR